MPDWDGTDIPPAFWKTLTKEEFLGICKNSELNRRLCRRLWAMEGRTDKPPRKLMVLLNVEDVMRVFPPKDHYN